MKVSVIGLGIMGTAVARRLLSAQHELTVHNRSREKADLLVESGAKWAATPKEAAREAQVIITMVKDPEAVAAVALGENGVLAGMKEDAVHAEMSTVSPQFATELAAEYAAFSRMFVQAPVLGSKKQIQDATLLIMAGGQEPAISTCKPVWQCFAKSTWVLDSASQAAAMKLACNMLIAQMILGLSQSMLFAKKYAVEPATLLGLLNESALGSPMYKAKGQSILTGNFQANFTVANMLKDLTLAAEATKAVDSFLAPNDLARSLFEQAVEAGFSAEDYSAVSKVLGEIKLTDNCQIK